MRSNSYQAARQSEMPTQQSVLQETSVFFYQNFIFEHKEFENVTGGNIKEFISNVITFAQTYNGVGNAKPRAGIPKEKGLSPEELWTSFCTRQELSDSLYSFENASRFSSAYNQIARKMGAENKRLSKVQDDYYLFLDTSFDALLVTSPYINFTPGAYKYTSLANHLPTSDQITSVIETTAEVTGRIVDPLSTVAGSVTPQQVDVADVLLSDSVTNAASVVGNGTNTVLEMTPTVVSEVMQRGGDAMTSVGNKTAVLGGDAIDRMSEMTPTVSEVMQRGGDAMTSVGNKTVELGEKGINEASEVSNCCEDTSWVAACCTNTGNCIVQTVGWVATCCQAAGECCSAVAECLSGCSC